MKQITKIPKFRRFVIQNFPFIEQDFDALTDYALICKIVEFLNKVITSQNALADEVENFENNITNDFNRLEGLFNELKSYVDHYFDNLDVQEEINNKLDDMVEAGTLQEIINAYIRSNATLGFDTLADMKSNENLVDGSYCHILGRISLNDGGENFYKVRTKTIGDVVDNVKIVQLHDPNLIAELIIKEEFLNIRPLHARFVKNADRKIATDVWYIIIPSDYKPELFLANDAVNEVEHADTNSYRNKTSILVNAGLFNVNNNETIGLIINNGETLKTNTDLSSEHSILYMTEDGTLNSVLGTTTTSEVEALNPVWAVTAWNAIVKDGVDYSSTLAQRDYKPRTFIGQDSSGNYIVGVCSGRQYTQQGLTQPDIKTFVESVGFTPYFLFNLDGGGSSIMLSDGQTVSVQSSFNHRQVANFIGWRKKDVSDYSVFKSAFNTDRIKTYNMSINNEPIDLLDRVIADPSNSSVVTKKGWTQSFVRAVNQIVFMQLAFTTTSDLAPYQKILTGLPLPFTTSLMNVVATNINDHSQHTLMITNAHDDDSTVDGFANLIVGRFSDLPAGDWVVSITYPFKTAENDDNFTV